MTTMFHEKFSRSACAAALCAGFALGLPMSASAQDEAAQLPAPAIEALAAPEAPPAFATPDAALDGFRQALQAPDSGALAALLGLDAAKLAADPDVQVTYALIKDGAADQLSFDGDADRGSLLIGDKLWPLPFPLVKSDDGKWAFDTYAGLEEIINRRVGENELETIATMHAYVYAQEEYAAQDRDGDGVDAFAQKLVSSEGTTDGLYWPADEVNGESPAGDLDQSALNDAAKGDGYFGYRYKILTGQGANIAGGAYDYVINGNMIAGFGLIAWPAIYGETGVKTFAVNQRGIVYETDLGPETGAVVKYIDRFNPDDTWEIVND